MESRGLLEPVGVGQEVSHDCGQGTCGEGKGGAKGEPAARYNLCSQPERIYFGLYRNLSLASWAKGQQGLERAYLGHCHFTCMQNSANLI